LNAWSEFKKQFLRNSGKLYKLEKYILPQDAWN
jgi:hypothetical protein